MREQFRDLNLSLFRLEELVHFLGYFVESTDKYVATVSEDSIKALHEKATTLKKSREWEAGYMLALTHNY